jgi:pilus assembly protein CpaD
VGAIIVLLAAGLGLGACANPHTNAELRTGSINMSDYKQRHPIVLAESAETLDVPVGSVSAKLSERLAHAITVFAAQSRLQGAPGVTILIPSGSANGATASRMARDIAAAIERGGVARRAITREAYEAADPNRNAPIRVAYTRMKAMVTHPCGIWPASVAENNNDNVDDYDFGCSTQSNIAAMVAHPSDLVTPAGEDPVDGTRRTTIIANYRKGEATQSKTTINVISTTGSE